MAKTTDVLRCAFCGEPTNTEAFVTDLMGCSHHRFQNRGHIVAEHRGHVFCSPRCERRRLAQLAGRPTCVHCRQQFTVAHPNGRRPDYCGEECRRARERQLNRAVRDLAKGKLPGSRKDLERALRDAVELADHWRGRRSDGRQVPRPTQPPEPAAVEALRRRIQTLRERLDQVVRGQASEDRRRAKDRRAAADAARRKAEVEDDQAWRERLLKGVGDG